MRKLITALFFISLWLVPMAGVAWGEAAEIAPVLKVEKIYDFPKPLGRLRVVFTQAKGGKDQALFVEGDGFKTPVPAKALADLPGADWDRLRVSHEDANPGRPYVYVEVPLRGPEGKPQKSTWVNFHFDADGKLTRYLKRNLAEPAKNGSRTLWKEWPVDAGKSAEAVLEETAKE